MQGGLYRSLFCQEAEASRQEIRSDIDFVLTFEEVVGMFTAKGIDFEQIPADGTLQTPARTAGASR